MRRTGLGRDPGFGRRGTEQAGEGAGSKFLRPGDPVLGMRHGEAARGEGGTELGDTAEAPPAPGLENVQRETGPGLAAGTSRCLEPDCRLGTKAKTVQAPGASTPPAARRTKKVLPSARALPQTRGLRLRLPRLLTTHPGRPVARRSFRLRRGHPPGTHAVGLHGVGGRVSLLLSPPGAQQVTVGAATAGARPGASAPRPPPAPRKPARECLRWP